MSTTKKILMATSFVFAIGAAIAPKASAFFKPLDVDAVAPISCAAITCSDTGLVLCGYVPGHCGEELFRINKLN